MRWSACVLALLLLSVPQLLLAQVDITNVGVDASLGFLLHGDLVAVRTSEARSGGIDLNGDGDALDFVLQVYDAATGVLTNTGHEASGGVRLSASLVAFSVLEARQGNEDLNGDGDTLDLVQHLYDASTGAVTNLGYASGDFRLEGDLLAFTALETGQGGLDMNGDGDAKDGVLHVYDAARGTTTSAGKDAAGGIVVDRGRVAFGVNETNEGGRDLNRDGDGNDVVLHVFDAATGATTNVGRATLNLEFQMDGELLGFLVRESLDGGADLNSDGDIIDNVLHVYDIASESTRSLGLAVEDFQLSGTLLAFTVTEAGHGGTDMTGDGDAADRVVHLFDGSDGSVRNLGYAVEGFQVDGHHLAFGVREFRQGNLDLNGDGDTADLILHLFDADTATTRNLGTDATLGFKLDGDMLLAFGGAEGNQGGDQNGDGDASDYTLYVYDISRDVLINFHADPSGGFQSFQVDSWYLSFGVQERAQGATDLNGDGDAGDIVLHLYSAEEGTTQNLGLDVTLGHQVHAGRIAFAVTEARQGATDLNGDGDALDVVLHVADLTGMSPMERIERLLAELESLGLPTGIAHSRGVHLEHAMRALENGDLEGAIRRLETFERSVGAQAGKAIDAGDASDLLEEARAIIDLLGGQA